MPEIKITSKHRPQRQRRRKRFLAALLAILALFMVVVYGYGVATDPNPWWTLYFGFFVIVWCGIFCWAVDQFRSLRPSDD
jgi:peptidoglycan/LPS O-acetylase OafA/YrhL